MSDKMVKQLDTITHARIKSGFTDYIAKIEFPKGEVKVEDFKKFCKKEGIIVTN